MSAPKHSPACGYATAASRLDYLQQNGIDDSNNNLFASQLIPDPDWTTPLYYWQLYALLGGDRITAIVRTFYTKIFKKEADEEFVSTFSSVGGLEHHIDTQKSYWIDAFGGGREYQGGHYRLNVHHQHNARNVMNAGGARTWMKHMGATLRLYDPVLRAIDPRIPLTLVTFLETKMRVYADQFKWRFEETDFELSRGQDRDLALAELTKRGKAGGRKEGLIRYSRRELLALKPSVLKSICGNLGLRMESGCEKGDIITAIAACEKVSEVIDEVTFTLFQLRRLSVKELKKMARVLDVNINRCVDKDDLVKAVSESENIAMVEEEEEKGEEKAEETGEEKAEEKAEETGEEKGDD